MSRRISLLICGLFTLALLVAGAGPVHASPRGVSAQEKKPRMGLGERCGKDVRCKKGLACRKGKDGRVCKKKKKGKGAKGVSKAGARKKGKARRASAKKTRTRKGKKRRGVDKVLDKVEGGLDAVGETIEGVEAIEDSVRTLGSQLKRLLDATKKGPGR